MSSNACSGRNPSRRAVMIWLAAGLAVAALPSSALAKRRRHGGHQDDDDSSRALEAVRSGKAAPLADIIDVVQKEVPGRVLEVEIEKEDGALIYEIKILSPEGQYLEVAVDARSKKILKVEQK